MSYFFRVPFAVEGDTAEILQLLQPNGTVSMQAGFTFDYERDPASDPNAKDIPRLETNWLNYVITDALRQYQTEGTFPFIPAALNGGNPFPYIKTARCRFEGELYESLVDNNTSTPADATKWRKISGVVADTGKYELCEFYRFRHPSLRSGFLPRYGGLLENARNIYPAAWAYLTEGDGQILCKTEAEWQAMNNAVLHTFPDGTQIRANGLGFVPFYAPNLTTGALRLPDTRGLYEEDAGLDGLDVGGVHIDTVRNATGSFGFSANGFASVVNGVFEGVARTGSNSTDSASAANVAYKQATFRLSRAMPTGNKVAPRAWGGFPCVFVGDLA